MEEKNESETEYKPHWMYHPQEAGMRYKPQWALNKTIHDDLERQGYSHKYSPFTFTFEVKTEEMFLHLVNDMKVYLKGERPIFNQFEPSGPYNIPFNTGRMSTTSALSTFQSVSSGIEH